LVSGSIPVMSGIHWSHLDQVPCRLSFYR
jgi:hypothetical protein